MEHLLRKVLGVDLCVMAAAVREKSRTPFPNVYSLKTVLELIQVFPVKTSHIQNTLSPVHIHSVDMSCKCAPTENVKTGTITTGGKTVKTEGWEIWKVLFHVPLSDSAEDSSPRHSWKSLIVPLGTMEKWN